MDHQYNEMSSPSALYFVLQLGKEKEWAKINSPFNYYDIVLQAVNLFPSLADEKFSFSDENHARVRENFVIEYIQMSQRGVLLNIVLDKPNLTDISTPASSKNSETSDTVSLSQIEDSSRDSSIQGSGENDTDCNNGKRQALRDISFRTDTPTHVNNNQKLVTLINENPCGCNIMEEYSQESTLSDKSRKLLVKIIAKELLNIKNIQKRRLNSVDKCGYAKAVIEIFPRLKNPAGPLGHEHFYDPNTRTGYIETALANISRQTGGQKRKLETNGNESSTPSTQEPIDPQIISDAIAFMKSAVPDIQREIICEKMKFTFTHRRANCMNETFFTNFPRFLDMPELVEIDFQLLHPESISDGLKKNFPSYVPCILQLYTVEKGNEKLLDWDRITNAFLALTQLLPPVAKGRKAAARSKKENNISNLITLIPNGTPLESLQRAKCEQPKLIAVGPNKVAVTQYFLAIDTSYILLPSLDVVEAVDFLFKAHFVFNATFDTNLSRFWLYLQKIFYNIDCVMTPKIIDIHSRICALKEKGTEEHSENPLSVV